VREVEHWDTPSSSLAGTGLAYSNGKLNVVPGVPQAPAVAATNAIEGALEIGQSNTGTAGSNGMLATFTGANDPTAQMFAEGSYLTNAAVSPLAIGGTVSLQNPPATYANPMVLRGIAVQQVYRDNALPVTIRVFGTVTYGGQPITSFLPGTQSYINSVNQAKAFNGVRPDLTPSRKITAFEFIQGESGPYDSTYAPALATVVNTLRNDIQTATGQASPPVAALWQTNANGVGTFYYSQPAEADRLLALSTPGVVLLGPSYFGPIDPVDNVHSTEIARMLMSDVYALAYKRIVNDGLPWNPLQQTSVTRSGAVLTVNYQLPPGGGNIALDTNYVPTTAGSGFYYADSGGVTAVSSVALGGNGTSVIVTLASTPTGTAGSGALYYAMGPASLSDNVAGWSSARGAVYSPTTAQSVFYRLGYTTIPQYVRHYSVRFGVSGL
jgi:hypothetical protein